jgi:hypothetical protein
MPKKSMNVVDPTDYVAHRETVEKLYWLNPDRAEALIKIAEFTLKEEQDRVRRQRPTRTLLARLQAVHDCPKPAGGGFVQLQGSASGAKSWRCEGCGQVVEL